LFFLAKSIWEVVLSKCHCSWQFVLIPLNGKIVHSLTVNVTTQSKSRGNLYIDQYVSLLFCWLPFILILV
jgi:hypothetical protein